jgi:hypothetical protein
MSCRNSMTINRLLSYREKEGGGNKQRIKFLNIYNICMLLLYRKKEILHLKYEV